MPDQKRKHRERRYSQEPDSENEYRRRRGHRATDSTGNLLPRPGNHESSSNSTPRKSRNSASESTPLSTGSLAQLNAVNKKKDKKKGIETYDEAYLYEVRAKEEKLEKERKRASRHQRRRSDNYLDHERRERRRSTQEYDRGAHARNTDNEEHRSRRRRERDCEEKDQNREIRRQDKAKIRPERIISVTDDAFDNEQRKSKSRRQDPEKWTRDNWKRNNEKYERIDSPTKPSKSSKKQRVISGPFVEDNRAAKVYSSGKSFFARNKRLIYLCIFIAFLIVIITVVAVVVSNKKKSSGSSGSQSSEGPANSNLNGISPSDIPAQYKNTYYDPFSWYDTEDFNVTFTTETVGGLPIMGLNSAWNNDVQCNPDTPPLTADFPYGSRPIRGMNVGGWLSLEPFITPSVFTSSGAGRGVVDEWTLCQALGSSAPAILEKHYSSFINKQTFADIKQAGFDHVRIPYSYWAVTTYPGDPYVSQISWRYLLRGIEYARQNGLRVKLDLHGLPGSQNGWNHSGRQGVIGWLNGTDGELNGQRSLDIHNQLSQFFAQPRYQGLITLYGLGNEPRMIKLDIQTVMDWIVKAIQLIQGNGIKAALVFGDGFWGLSNWQGRLNNLDNLILDVHQYVIFSETQINLTHTDKVNYACQGWSAQMSRSMNKATGFGPTMCAEWSQADTDCATYLNNVGSGTRWEGTLSFPLDPANSVLTPMCPTKNNPPCDCNDANADPSNYSPAYKQFLLDFAEAQMSSFEVGWGWFYWTWLTESAVQWSWKLGMEADILPRTVMDRQFNCKDTIPDYSGMGLSETF